MLDQRGPTSDLFEAMATQRAIRRWRPEPVPDALIWRVIEAATQAPSGSNRQPWRFVVVRDPQRRARIAELLREHLDADSAMLRYFTEGATSKDRSTRLMLEGALALVHHLDQAPLFIIPCLYVEDGRAPQGLRAGSSIYGAVQNLQLAARALGIGSVLTSFDAIIEQPLRTILSLPGDASPVALILLGLPDADFGPVNRKPVEAVTFWEEWGTQRTRATARADPPQ